MKMRDLISKLRDRKANQPMRRDWTNNWTPRDWADLPTHHPRREDEAL
ncbi:MAG: hypothetical protein JWQ89_1567 [Devosia sp.]|nr:hypothetical protein [Devosia sp.]MDB5539840.1 hypothetical protein [Devosia sp.]